MVVVGTGGLSHQLNGERAGFNNTEWDMKFLELIERDPDALTAMKHADYIRLGGTEGAEEIMWLAMRGALSGRREEDPPELLPADDQRRWPSRCSRNRRQPEGESRKAKGERELKRSFLTSSLPPSAFRRPPSG